MHGEGRAVGDRVQSTVKDRVLCGDQRVECTGSEGHG